MVGTTTEAPATARARGYHTSPEAEARLKKRYAAERRFKAYGIIAIVIALAMLTTLLGSIVSRGYSAFVQTELTLDVTIERSAFPETPDQQAISRADYQGMVIDTFMARFPEVEGRTDRRALRGILSDGAGYEVRALVVENPDLIGQTITVDVPVASDFDQLNKGFIDRDLPQAQRRVTDQQIEWFDQLKEAGLTSVTFNTRLFTNADSRDPELAGLWGAVKGSFYLLVVTLLLSFPIGVSAAIYLEEFAPKNRWTDLIEVNINNLAAVPSIVFGLLGLAVFLQVFGLPRSAPLVGGMVLALMTLPTIIIASRASLKAVPPSIREAALGMGASRLQAMFHHTLPLAMPGILTGTIIGMAQALGETAPLLMIGMNAFIVDAPSGFTDPATALPVQVYIWSDSPERGFVERTSAAIMVLIGFLILMNGTAIWLRKKFERRW
jgi:phosphate transport system permease protein